MKLSDTLKPGLRGVFYGRHSTDHQEMLMQRNSVEEFVAKYGCVIVEEYLDAAVSATKNKLTDRKSISKLLDDTSKGHFDFVAIYSNDRVARNPMEHEYIRVTMRLHGIPIVVSSTDSLYDSKDDLIAQLLRDGISKFEVDNIKIRTRDGLISQAKLGKWTGGNAPFGYRYIKEEYRFETYPEELELVRQIYSLYRKEEGFASIAEKMPQRSYKGKDWTKDKVKAIVTNPFYAGYISWGKRQGNSKSTFTVRDEWIVTKSDYIEPIISSEEWEVCWRIYQNKKEGKIPPKHYKTSFLFRGIAVCKHCKKPLQTKNQTTSGNGGKKYGQRIYTCNSCVIRIEASEFHSYVIDEILNDVRINNPVHIFSEVSKSMEYDADKLQKEIAELEQAITNYQQQVKLLEIDLKTRMQNVHGTDEQLKLTKVMTLYRLHVLERIRNTEKLILTKQKELLLLKNVGVRTVSLDSLLKELAGSRDEIEQTDLRRMLVHLVEQISIDRDKKIEVKTKFNMEKRKVNKQQLEFTF